MSPSSFLHESYHASAPDGSPADTRPEPKSIWHHLSLATRKRTPSLIKGSYKYFFIPGIGQLAGGLPNPYYFPFDTLEAKVARPDRWEPTPNRPVDPPSLDSLSLASGSGKARSKASPLDQPQDAIRVPFKSAETDRIKEIDIKTALQYGTAEGYPPLYYFIRQFTRNNLHPNCPYKGGPEVILTCGNTDGWAKTLLAFCNEWNEEKDWIRDREGVLCEQFTFAAALQQCQPRGVTVTPVAVDEEGMLAEGPGGLRDVLENWDFSKGRRPHLMYTVTVGQNPTSGILSLARRREIYALSCKYDIVIVEDDPYWYLQYPTATAVNTTTTLDAGNVSFNPDVPMFANAEPRPDGWKSSGHAFLDSLVPSYISIDVEGRVVRLDTFSKTVAPGCRLGWITAQPALIERLLCITESTTQQPSGFVQANIAELLLGPDQHGIAAAAAAAGKFGTGAKDGGPLRDGTGWKADGWVRWLEGLRGNYERRMNRMSATLDAHKYLVKAGRRPSLAVHPRRGKSAAGPVEVQDDDDDDDVETSDDEWAVVERTQMYSFHWPMGGMFLWLHVHFERHPLYTTYRAEGYAGLARLARALWLFWTTKPHLVLASAGPVFAGSERIREEEGWKYYRLCFAAIDDDDIVPVSKRLAEGVAAFWRIKDRKIIDRLVDEETLLAQQQGRPELAQLAGMMGPC